jgi:hypothetical protein
LYAYRGANAEDTIDDLSHAGLLEVEMESAISEVRRRVDINLADMVDLVESGEFAFSSSEILPAKYARFKIYNNELVNDSFLLLTSFKGNFIKVRYSAISSVLALDRARCLFDWTGGYLDSLLRIH